MRIVSITVVLMALVGVQADTQEEWQLRTTSSGERLAFVESPEFALGVTCLAGSRLRQCEECQFGFRSDPSTYPVVYLRMHANQRFATGTVNVTWKNDSNHSSSGKEAYEFKNERTILVATPMQDFLDKEYTPMLVAFLENLRTYDSVNIEVWRTMSVSGAGPGEPVEGVVSLWGAEDAIAELRCTEE